MKYKPITKIFRRKILAHNIIFVDLNYPLLLLPIPPITHAVLLLLIKIFHTHKLYILYNNIYIYIYVYIIYIYNTYYIYNIYIASEAKGGHDITYFKYI